MLDMAAIAAGTALVAGVLHGSRFEFPISDCNWFRS
jgi:hypothetical protein